MHGQSLTQLLRDNGALDSRGRWIIGSTHRFGGCWEGALPTEPDLVEQLAGIDPCPWLPAPLFESADFITCFTKANQYLRARRDEGLTYTQMYHDDHLAEAVAVAAGDAPTVELAIRLKDKLVEAIEKKVRAESQHARKAQVLRALCLTSDDLFDFPYIVSGEDNRAWRDFLRRHLLPDVIVMAEANAISLPFPRAAAAVHQWVAGLNAGQH